MERNLQALEGDVSESRNYQSLLRTHQRHEIVGQKTGVRGRKVWSVQHLF